MCLCRNHGVPSGRDDALDLATGCLLGQGMQLAMLLPQSVIAKWLLSSPRARISVPFFALTMNSEFPARMLGSALEARK